MDAHLHRRVALIEAGSPGLNIYSHVAMGRGIAILATVVRDAGYEVRAFIEDVSGRDSVDWDWVRTADVIGFSAITCTMPRTRVLLEQARSVAPQATILFGGPEPTCAPQRSFDLGADMVLRGEAELTLPRLLDAMSGRTAERFEDIEGLMWRAGNEVAEGRPPRQLTREELDRVPLVDRSLVHLAGHSSVASVWRARGCPSRCDFCEVCEIWPRYVSRSPERSVEELFASQSEGYQTAFLIDDNAGANKRAFKEFLRDIVSRGYFGMLVAQLRADTAFDSEGRVDRELLRLLKRAAAVTVICVGVESADDDNLEALNKREDSSHMARALKAMRRHGLLVHGMFIALNSDTRAIIRKNGLFARRYVTSLQYLFETPLPGTKRTAAHSDRGALLFQSLDDLYLYDGMHVVIRPERMTAREMQELVTREYRRFYSWWRITLSALQGAFARHRLLTPAQKEVLARLRGGARLKRWLWLHIQYKFAPVSLLAIGRQRVRAIVSDPEYSRFTERLRRL